MPVALNTPYSWSDVSLTQLDAVACQLAAECQPGMAFGIQGDLGAGKTTLIQRLCHYWGVTDPVNSPTFGYMHTYLGVQFPVLHADLYQARPVERIIPELLDVLIAQTHVMLIEWSNCWPDRDTYLTGTFTLTLQPDNTRHIVYQPHTF